MKFLYSVLILFLSINSIFAQTVRLDVAGGAKIVGNLELADAAKSNTFIGTLVGIVNNTGASITFVGKNGTYNLTMQNLRFL